MLIYGLHRFRYLRPALIVVSAVLDFEKHNFLKTGLESLPKEFQEAVKAKEARIGMDQSTVIMAMGRPDKRSQDNDSNGQPQVFRPGSRTFSRGWNEK